MDATQSDPAEDTSDSGLELPAADLRVYFLVAAVAAALGAIFSAVSTNDFIAHLDRQVHSIHCSFIPGAGKELGESGCRTVMMSPYSSVFRGSRWGGIPISLWSLAVFAFLFYRSALHAWRRTATRGEANFLLAGWGLPVFMTLLYGFFSVVKVGATCKVCVGIYLCSFVGFAAVFLAWQKLGASAREPRPAYPMWFAEGVAFVVVLTLGFLAATPGGAAPNKAQGCGTLVQGDDPSGVMLELASKGKTRAIEVLDPLCPACKAFDERLRASDLDDDLDLSGVLFPLDPACNWMVTEALHPGACAVSEAILCANGLGNEKNGAAARKVLAWAFARQDALRELAAKDEGALRSKLEKEFPAVKGCLGGYAVKNKLTKSLRWAVANAVPVLTPQLFVKDRRLCDEDTDLGLEYTLRKAISSRGEGKGGKR